MSDQIFDGLLGIPAAPKGAPLTNASGESPVTWQPSGTAKGLDPSVAVFAAALAKAGFADLPVTSGYRSPEKNAQVGGAKGSQHMQGRALDIDVSQLSDAQKAQVLDIAVRSGVKGVGIYPGGKTLHLDSREGGAATWGAGANTYQGVPAQAQPGWAQGALKAMLSGEVGQAAPGGKPLPPAPKAKPQADPFDAQFDSLLGTPAAQAGPADFESLLANDPRKAEAFQTFKMDAEKDPAYKGIIWKGGKGYDETTGALKYTEKPQETSWGTVESVVNGLGLGYLPEVAGAIASRVSGDEAAGAKLTEDLAQARKNYGARNPLQSTVEELGGSLPTTIAAGGALNRGLQAVPLAGRFLAGEAGAMPTVTRRASEVVNGAIQGAQGNVISGKLQDDRDVTWQQRAAEGAAGGAVVGGVVGQTLAGSPSRAIPTRQMGQAGERARDLVGDAMTSGQILGQKADPDKALTQLERVTRRLAERFGADAAMDAEGVTGFTPRVMERAKGALSDQYRSVFQQAAPIQDFDRQLGMKLRDVWTQARAMPLEQRRQILAATDSIANTRINGRIEPEAIQQILKWEGPIGALKNSSDGNMRRLATEMHREVQSFLLRNLRDVNGNRAPQLVRQYVETNKKWATMENLKPAIYDAMAADKGNGFIDPQKLGVLARNPTRNERVKDPVLRQAMEAVPALPKRGDVDAGNVAARARAALGYGKPGAMASGLAGAGAGGAALLENLPGLALNAWSMGAIPTGATAAGLLAAYGANKLQGALRNRAGTIERVLQNARTQSAPSNRGAINKLATPAGRLPKWDWDKDKEKGK